MIGEALLAPLSKAPNLTQQVSRAVAWNVLLVPLKVVVELGANLIILNILTLPQVGLLRLVSAAAASLGIWADLGVDRALPRFIPELEQRGRWAVTRFMTVVFAGKALLLGLMSLFCLLFASRFLTFLTSKAQELDPQRFGASQSDIQSTILQLGPWLVASVLTLVVLGSLYDGLMAYLISYFRQRAWNLIGLVGSVIQPLLTAALVLAGWGVAGVLVAMVVTPVISVALAARQVLGVGEWSLKVGSDHAQFPAAVPWRRFMTYTSVSNVLNLSDYFISHLFALFLLNDLALGALYSVGTALVRMALGLVYAPLAGVQVPLITRVKGGDGTLAGAYAGIGRILALILLPGGVGLMLLARGLIEVQYPQFADATLVVFLLTPCLFLESFFSTSQIILQVYERYQLLLLTRGVTLLALPLLLWAAPRYGLAGAALAVGGGRVLMGLTAALLVRRAFDLRQSWAFFGRVALATLAMGAVVGGLAAIALQSRFGLTGATLQGRALEAGVLVCVAGAGALVFGLVLRLLGGLEGEDRLRIAESRLPGRKWLLRFL